MDNINLQQYKTVWLGTSVLVAVWLGLIFNVFYGFDRLLYDKQMQLSYVKQAAGYSVVLIEADQSFKYASAQVWTDTLSKLNALKPRVIVLPSTPHTWSASETQYALNHFPLITGNLYDASRALVDHAGSYPALTLLPPFDGIGYRQQWLVYETEAGQHKSLELAVAEKLTGYKTRTDQNRFYIDFRGADGRIPVIEIIRIQKGELVESLIQDRVVLIGYLDALEPKLFTPMGNITFSLYQAHALDTLLNANEINNLGLVPMLLLSLIAVICLMLLVPRISDRYQVMSFFVILFLTFLVSWALFVFAELWIQPGVFVIAESAVFIALYYERYKQYSMQLHKMVLKSASSVEHRWLPQNFYASEEHWTQIANMVSQTLSLNRTIFLDRVKDDHRLKEIKALNCSLDDINEMRRDYLREPYTTAIDKGGILRIDREYFKDSNEAERQYLVPLKFAGEILGFWALTLKETNQLDEKKILHAIDQFSTQISEMLFHRKQWIIHQQYQQQSWVKLLNLKFDESAYTSVNHAINFMGQRLSVMESVMDGMGTSAVLYDLFGRVIQVNKAMSAALSEIDLAPYSITAADLISQLSSCSLIEARNYLRYVIIDKGTINLPVNHKNIETGYMLTVHGLNSKEDIVMADGDVRPFEIIGILCELVDMTRISEVAYQKEKVIEHLAGWLKNDLSSITIACDLAKDERVGAEKKAKVIDMVKDKVTSLGKSFERVNDIINSDIFSHISAHYPVDCQKPLLASINDSQKNQHKSVNYITQFPFYIPLVLAAPNELKQIFDTILKILCEDVMDKGSVTVRIINKNENLEFDFSNEGYGIPDEHLQAYMHNEETLESDEFKALRTIKNQIEDWNGVFNAYSAVGQGMRFTFHLQSFQAYE